MITKFQVTRAIGVIKLCTTIVQSFSLIVNSGFHSSIVNPAYGSQNTAFSEKRPASLFRAGDIDFTDVKLIFSDMDGTLLLPSHRISERSIHAISAVKAKGIPFLPATGRNRPSMLAAVGPQFLQLFGDSIEHIPGIFSQGLVVYGMDGKLIHQEFLPYSIVMGVENFCRENSLSMIAYSGDTIYTTEYNNYTLGIMKYNDVKPELVPQSLLQLETKAIPLNKLIILSEDPLISKHRPELEKHLFGKASFTSAVKGMLEVLPFGASKGKGVQKFLEYHDVDRRHVMAFGDAENDLEMIKLVKYGIAMENAQDDLFHHAYRRTLSNRENGVAYILEHVVA